MTTSIIEPGTIEPPAGELPFLRMPERNIFEMRTARLRTLAVDHALGDYLGFLAGVARAQHSALSVVRDVPLPTSETIAHCREQQMPPLGARAWKRAPVWLAALRHILAILEANLLPAAARSAIEALQKTDDAGLERLADALLGENFAEVDTATATFIAAALQVYWLHMTTSLGEESFGRTATPSHCPACGSPPVSSMVRIGGADHSLRYLHCSLCSMQWHVVRIKCSFCDSTQGISYYEIERGNAAIKAECCEGCKSYLKILYMDKDRNVDAVADDVASIALDILMAETGVARGGVNFFLLGGNAVAP